MLRPFDDAYAAGKAAWPGIALDRLVFDAHAARVLGADSPKYPADFYLACACANGVARAVEAFERTYAADLARAVRKVHDAPAFVDDTTQAVRERLFVARREEGPRIAQYTGRGPLRSWVAAIAVHLAVRLRTAASNRPHQPLDSRMGALLGATPDVAIIRDKYKTQLEEALQRALASLPPRERTLLRLHLVEKMTIDGIGATFDVGRSTAARWLQAARESLLAETRNRFCETTRVTPSEFASIAGALRSDLDVSIAAHLAAPP